MRIALACALLLVPLAAQAQEERFRIERTDSGYVRLDTRTGAVSTCRESEGQLVCRMAADERQAMQTESDRLQAEIDALESRVAALEARPGVSLPSEQEFDKTLGYMEQFMRRFLDLARDAERDKPAPDRT